MGIGLAVSAGRLGVAFALGLFGLLVGYGEDLFFLAVGVGADAQSLFFAFRSILTRDPLALCAHARVHALLVLLRQVQAVNSHIYGFDSILRQRGPVGHFRNTV